MCALGIRSTTATSSLTEYHATTDKATPINLSQHSYFNLTGGASGDILGHMMMTSTRPVHSGGFDVDPDRRALPHSPARRSTSARPRRSAHGSSNPIEQFKIAADTITTWCSIATSSDPTLAVHVCGADQRTARSTSTRCNRACSSTPETSSTARSPGRAVACTGGAYGFCLETQHFPDSPNHPSFPSTILRPGHPFNSRTVFVFGSQK